MRRVANFSRPKWKQSRSMRKRATGRMIRVGRRSTRLPISGGGRRPYCGFSRGVFWTNQRGPRICVGEERRISLVCQCLSPGRARMEPATLDDFMSLNDQLAAAVEAGVPLDVDLGRGQQETATTLEKINALVARRVSQGSSLSAAIANDDAVI